MGDDYLTIDTHTFAGYNPFQDWDCDPLFNLDRFEDTRFLTVSFHASENAEAIARAESHPKILGTYLMFNSNRDHPIYPFCNQDEPVVLEELADNPQVIGANTIPSVDLICVDDDKRDPTYAVFQNAGKPIMIHMSYSGVEYSSVAMVEKVLEKYPRLKIIGEHGGGVRPDYMKSFIELAERYPERLVMNTTTIDPLHLRYQVDNRAKDKSKKKLVLPGRDEVWRVFLEAVERIPTQIIYGTDLGWLDADDITDWPMEKLTPEQRKQIMHTNAIRWFNLKDIK